MKLKVSDFEMDQKQKDKLLQLQIDLCELTIFTLKKIMPGVPSPVILFYQIQLALDQSASAVINQTNASNKSLEYNLEIFLEQIKKRVYDSEQQFIEVKG